jgi:hypothetical protein
MGIDLKTSASNFIKILKKLAKGQSKDKIIKELNNTSEPILHLDWLKEKSS